MGTDIHSIAQIKKNGAWMTVARAIADDDRNYDSFAVLADVRNGQGFAGIVTGEGWRPISQPRGLPADLLVNVKHGSPSIPTETWYYQFDKDHSDPQTSFFLGEHSHSWVTLKEIETHWAEFVAHGHYLRHGIMARDVYLKMVKDGIPPQSWSGGIDGRGIKVVDQLDFTEASDATHVRCQWPVPAAEALRYLKQVIQELQQIRVNLGVAADDVRFVFGFDS